MPTDPLALTNVNDPDVLNYLLQQGGLNAQAGDADRKMMMAQQLRGMTAAPQGRQSGGIYTAANPLEHVASAVGQGLAGRQQMQAQQSMTDIGQQRQQMMEALARKLQTGAPAAPPAPSALAQTYDPSSGATLL